ncbi:STAS domain-containing protein [Actinokineospora soli]|uniref:STAS domain-containing protein n=1 Tax=Actinokineospora soli TaxID=1048753 RepID=A0ABW2TTI2_9PSEU
MTPLTVTRREGPDGTALLAVQGEIDMSNSATLTTALEATDGPVTVDLTAVDYLDSAGLAVLFTHSDRIAVIAGPLLGPVLTYSGLADVVAVRGIDPPRA